MKKGISVLILISLIGVFICGCSTNKANNITNEATISTENTVEETTISKETSPENQTVKFKDFTLTFPSNWIYTENETGVEFCEKTNYEQNFSACLMSIGKTTSNPDETMNSSPYTVLGKQLGKYYVSYEPNGYTYNYEDEQLTNNYNKEKAKIQDVLKTFKLDDPYNEYGYTDFGLSFENAVQNYKDAVGVVLERAGRSVEGYECRATNAVLVDKNSALTVMEYKDGQDYFDLYLNEAGNVVYFSCYTTSDNDLPTDVLAEWCVALTNPSAVENSNDSELFVPVEKVIKELMNERENSDELYVTKKYEDLSLYCFYADNLSEPRFEPYEVYDADGNVVVSLNDELSDQLIEFSMIYSNDDFNKYYAEYLENH